MSEQLLTILKLCLLVLLYLFFLRVLRAVWAELRTPVASAVPANAGVTNRPARKPAGGGGPRGGRRGGTPKGLRVVEPAAQKGRTFPLGDEITVGRAAGCSVTLDDTYVSQIHSRVFIRDGKVFVEDLGSTNGTYLEGVKVQGPMVMKKGDRLKVGSTVMELA
ncbi:MAG: FHA domain-containing protein [Acidimicrobiales bacterium]|nr:FHA domain-containing protein [Acidimicrobiales bacterium]MCB9373910.1 FHA domain-containing protein [Microthrixaceae bacterium]